MLFNKKCILDGSRVVPGVFDSFVFLMVIVHYLDPKSAFFPKMVKIWLIVFKENNAIFWMVLGYFPLFLTPLYVIEY